MSSTYPEPKQIACMKRGRCDFETGAKTERLLITYQPEAKSCPESREDSLGVPQEDPKESLRFGRVVVAGRHMSREIGADAQCGIAQSLGFYYSVRHTFLAPLKLKSHFCYSTRSPYRTDF